MQAMIPEKVKITVNQLTLLSAHLPAPSPSTGSWAQELTDVVTTEVLAPGLVPREGAAACEL